MCGLAGYTRPGADAEAVLGDMIGRLVHRGPDGSGISLSTDVALAHSRLVVIDREGGVQPRVDAASGDALVFNGEIYGFERLAEELRRDGAVLRDHCDTEVLFHLLRRHGVAGTLDRIEGMFAFAFFDAARRVLHLVRDRFGEKPLFYARRNGRVVFASELGALVRHPDWRRTPLCARAVDCFLTFDYVPGAETGLDGVFKVRPGHRLAFGPDGAMEETCYFAPRPGGRGGTLNREEAEERLDALLRESVHARLVADVPTGVLLSGGVDSGLIAALAAQKRPGITAYTLRVPHEGYDEGPSARRVAEHCGLHHELVDLGEAEFVDAFDTITRRLEDFLADPSLVPTALLCREARRGLTVALGGDGADELLAGYPNFWLWRYAPVQARLPRSLGRLVRRVCDAGGGRDRYMSLGFKVRQAAQGWGHPPHRQNALWMAPLAPSDRTALWRPELRPTPPDQVFEELDRLAAESAPTRGIDPLLRAFQSTYLPDDILTKTDRASMFWSLEVRAPMLAEPVAAFIQGLPAHWKYDGRTGKAILKSVCERYLPREVVHRRKHGFGAPLGSLIRGPLSAMVRETVLDATNPAAPLFRRAAIERMIARQTAGAHLHKALWALFILFRVARTLDAAPPR